MICISIFKSFKFRINIKLKINHTPSPAGEGWGEENKINYLNSPSSRPSPSREKGTVLV
jgi:hypothetical protein